MRFFIRIISLLYDCSEGNKYMSNEKAFYSRGRGIGFSHGL
jgi:hypothetical protein